MLLNGPHLQLRIVLTALHTRNAVTGGPTLAEGPTLHALPLRFVDFHRTKTDLEGRNYNAHTFFYFQIVCVLP